MAAGDKVFVESWRDLHKYHEIWTAQSNAATVVNIVPKFITRIVQATAVNAEVHAAATGNDSMVSCAIDATTTPNTVNIAEGAGQTTDKSWRVEIVGD